ncbi:hypothetical protein ACS5PJ_19680 [Pseudarthrobacter sp. YS3]|uniref:hypothetical protein n=1 Tax=Pseudarthrobacter sp. YS3 TaxID=3453718 RepID=UPI003EEE77E9
MTTAKRRAPDPEWVLMYRQGIPSPKIAAGAGAAASTVRYHLHLAIQVDPGLRDEHKAAAEAKLQSRCRFLMLDRGQPPPANLT